MSARKKLTGPSVYDPSTTRAAAPGRQSGDEAERKCGGGSGLQVVQGRPKRFGDRQALGAKNDTAFEIPGRRSRRLVRAWLVERSPESFLVQPCRFG